MTSVAPAEAQPAASTDVHLALHNVQVVYDNVILAVKGLSLEVPRGDIVTLLGANGAGKSTTLKAISGLLRTEKGEVTNGTITFEGHHLERQASGRSVRLGISQVMEGRRVFAHLSVTDNLVAGAHTQKAAGIKDDIARVLEYFPHLGERMRTKAGYLSGGEQQMLAIARALMAHPRLLLLDEPSLGLAPLVVAEIFEIVRRLNEDEGVTILLVEQNANLALELASHGYVMEDGRVVLDGPAAVLKENDDIREFYLGISTAGRKSYRDVKHYKRRKRWLS
ncbi:MAG: ATP-binding cassette domain-containing protein [Acidimicrobiia bacterium]|nr:ATP-binding cassette domain-containing protein [Acidimicrobiia bacterium]